MNDIKNILLIGRTGRGKSTLANVLVNKNNNFEEVFKESAGSISETRNIQFEGFKKGVINYGIIDTPGIGDTKLNEHQILDIIAKAVYLARDGINQVFFVTEGRFDQFEMATYNLLRTTIFDENITNYTSIIRTKFPNFDEEEECEKDIVSMIEKGGELEEIINSCDKRIIHVDNPPLNDNRKLEINKEKRSDSREILFSHLNKFSQLIYKPQNLKEIGLGINDDMSEKEKIEEEMGKLKEEIIKKDKEIWTCITFGLNTRVLRKDKERLEKELAKKTNAIRGKVWEHVRSKIQNTNLANYFDEIPTKKITLSEKLNWKYPSKESKEKVEKIWIDFDNPLWYVDGGELDLKEYPNLKELVVEGFQLKTPLTKLNLSNCPNLELLYCIENQLTSLDLSRNRELKKVTIAYENIRSIDFLKKIPFPEKLVHLDISNNMIQRNDLEFLKPFKNLVTLSLGNYDENRIEKGIYNHFRGSLKPLKEMTKLKELCIANTDIDIKSYLLNNRVEHDYETYKEYKQAQIQHTKI